MEQTIAAISTSTMSSGGISIVRLSGIDAVDIADKVFTAKNNKKLRDVKSHTIHYGLIKDGDEVIDEVLVSVYKRGCYRNKLPRGNTCHKESAGYSY